MTASKTGRHLVQTSFALRSFRTIILVVIQATNDIANQKIIQRARKFDRAGQRTVGLITKVDLINKHTEPRIALLTKNKDMTKLKLGYFLLKNPTPSQLNAAWKEQQLDISRVGIEALRTFLQELLEQHIEREFPKVRSEIKKLLFQTESEIADLGDERSSVGHMCMFLTRLSMGFYNLAQAALDGNYHVESSSFFDDSDEFENPTRLRAEVHRLNGEFAADISENAQKRKLVDRPVLPSTDSPDNTLQSDSSSELDDGFIAIDS
ncbi:hypothetical protein B0O99DRAFT_656641 [Bisporella sp. PMI_857]|nr:hypothetical protein B0O99DRAFT_656641 [Bisporella sp. PMI_857]